jgi:hypothetical protein
VADALKECFTVSRVVLQHCFRAQSPDQTSVGVLVTPSPRAPFLSVQFLYMKIDNRSVFTHKTTIKSDFSSC